jgi:hypothetical protein
MNYELGFYIPEDGILHSHRCENLKSYMYSIHHMLTPTLGHEHLTLQLVRG